MSIPKRLYACLLVWPAWVLSVAILMAIGSPARTQEQPAPALSNHVPNRETLSNRIRELEASKDIDEAFKTRLLDFYRLAVSRLDGAEAFSKNAEHFRKTIETAPVETKRIRQEMADNPPPALSDVEVDVPKEALSKELEPLLTKEQAALGSLKSRLGDLDGQIKAEQDRPEKIRSQMAAARQKLDEIDVELKATTPKDEDPRVTEARLASLDARKLGRQAEVAALEQELLSYECRLNLLKAMRDQVASQVPVAEARVQAIQGIVNRRRLEEAKQTKEEAKQAEQNAQWKHVLIRTEARENAELSQEIESCVKNIAAASDQHQKINEQLEINRNAFENMRQQIEKIGLRGVLGKVLLRERQRLPDPRAIEKEAAKRRELISTINFEIFNIDESRAELDDLDGKVAEILLEELEESLTPSQRGLIEHEVRVLFESRRTILDSLADSYVDYVKKLGAIDFDQKLLLDDVRVYASYLEERLLWIPNSKPIDLSVLSQASGAVLWFALPFSWIETGKSFCLAALDNPVATGLTVILLFILVFYRRRFRKILEVDAAKVGKIHLDGFPLTLKALAITAWLALPGPLVIGFSSWLLLGSYEVPEFAKAVGRGLGSVAWMFLAVQFLRGLCHKGGAAAAHFRWTERSLTLLRRNLLWLVAIVVPARFVISTLEWQDSELFKVSLGRFSFIVEMLAVVVFTAIILKPRGGVLERFLARNPNGWISKLRYVWYSLAVCTPLVLIALSGSGYHYTALRLEGRLFATIALTVAAIIVNNVVLRWLFITHGKLALAKARERREAARAAESDAGGSADSTAGALPIDIPEFDLGKISQQTRDFLRALLSLTVVVGVWLIWADVLPALNILNDVELWYHSADVDGELSLIPVTLADLVLVLLIIILTSLAARNLPGVLEIAVLQYLPLDRGSRYAVTTISRYLITSIGVVIALGTIGLTWSSIQWVVAALGVGLGFGLHEIFNNFISGLIILFERPIRVGDTVTVGGIDGTVSRIRMRATTITDWDRKELVVPNKTFITEQLVNWTLSDPITRVIVKVGIAYGSDTDLALDVMQRTALSVDSILDDPSPQVLFLGFGESSLEFEVRVFVRGIGNFMLAKHFLHMAIDKAFREKGIVIAFPQRDIHLSSAAATISVDGPRRGGRGGAAQVGRPGHSGVEVGSVEPDRREETMENGDGD